MSARSALEPFVAPSLSPDRPISTRKRWRQVISLAGALVLLAVSRTSSAQMVAAPPLQVLPNHVSKIVNGQSARFLGPLPDSQKMQLSIVLPLRNQDQLDQLLVRLYDPGSSDYHKFLSVEEFADRFGPTEDDYQEVVEFATANGFAVTGQAKNRLVVAIEGTVAQVNGAFHVRMGEYQHPAENRSFFSPDREPSVALRAQIAHIDGMDSLNLPRATNILPSTNVPIANVNGSGPGGSYLGSDMRAAYYGGSTLTGLNQTVALVEFGGYLKSDVDLNFSGAGQTYGVPLENILVGSATNTVYQQDAEQVLDIVQAIGMAPGLSAVEVYIGDPTSESSPAAVLNQIATDDTAKQIGCSWLWIPGSIPAQEAILQEMAAQGQTFFVASGDEGAYQASISTYFYPAESQYVTAVGGTHLTTVSAGGAWSSEVAWNSDWAGSGGGISPDGIPIPSWQSGLATSSNGGSNTLRNVPDVAAEGDFDNYACNLGSCADTWAGTSFATPRWAGFMALVNQQAVEAGNAPLGGVGFIDAALSQIGTGSDYSADFHDIQLGNNDTDDQTVWFNAVTGYDLVTGWGSPAGQSLIDDLAGKAVPGFWISSSAGTVNVIQGGNATATISVIDADGFSGVVNLAATSTLPSGVTASFSPTSTSSSSVLTLTTSNAAAQGSYPVTIAGTSGTITESTTFDLVIHGPSFTLSSGSILTVNQGASATSTITVNDLYGFTGSVNLQASGLPSGLTASFGANPTSTTSVLTLTASSTAASWIGYITVTGTSGSLTASTQIYVNLVAPGFTLLINSGLSMGQGSTSSTYVDISASNGFTGNVTLSVTGLPSGVTAFFTPNPITSSGELTIVAGSSAAVGSATLTVTGTSGSITATATLTLTVNAPGFTLSGGGSVSLGQGLTWTNFLYVNDQYGFNGSVTLSASGLPAGVTASFATNPTTYSSQITFTASSSAAAGTYPVTVTGTAGSVTATSTYILTVGAPTFTISAPSSQTLSQSGSIGVYLYVNDQYGFTGSVTFSVSGLPAGVTASFGTNPTTYSSAMTLTASSSAATGNYTVTVTGTSGSIGKATTMTLSIVAPSIQISSPGSITLGIGTSSSTYVYVYGNNGFSGNVTMSMCGLPSGITASFSPNPISLSGYSNWSQLTLTASGSVAAGSYTATLTGTSGSVTASTSFTISVAAPGFTLFSSYSSLTIGQGGSGTAWVYANGTNGFNGSVTLSLGALPSGVTAAFDPNPTTYSSAITFSATNSAPTGTYPVTITGTSGSIVATTTMMLTVAAPSFTLSPGQSAYTLNQGASFQSYLYSNGANGFSGAVTLSASGLPSGVTLSFGTNPTTYYSSMTFTASSSATPGTSTVTITGTSGSITASTTVTVTVDAPSFTLIPAPGSITLLPGGSDKTSVAVGALNGFSGSVSFSIAGLPSGVTASWNPASSATGSVLTLTATSSAQPGAATATITGTSGALSATAQLPITIRSPATSSTTALAITAAGSSVTTTAWGTLVTLTASVTSGGSPITSGLVNFCDSAASYCGDIHLLGSAQLNSNGAASMNLLPLLGSHSYKAVFAGTAANGASASPAGSLQVTGAYPTITSLTSSGTVGNYTLNATVNGTGPQLPTGSVSFVDTSSNNSTIGTASLVAGTSTLSWYQLSTMPTGPYPGATVTADFNGDGISDVAILDPQYSAITIEFGNVDGTFITSYLSPQTSPYPVAITTADFNGDGIPDLAVVTSAGIVNIFLGNGDGTFNAVGTIINTGAIASAIVAGDFNGDGIPDLAINDSPNSRLVILLGKGDGTFTTSTSYPATGSSPEGMAVADFNGDGVLDIAVANYISGTVSILLGNGDGTFSPTANAIQVTSPTSVVVADFNRDGKPDLAVASEYSFSLAIFLGNGDGTFTPKSSPAVNYYTDALVPIDVNQDGIVDLVAVSWGQPSANVLLGNGDGTFTAGSSVTLPAGATGAAAARVTSSGFPGVIVSLSSLSEAVALEPYWAQAATASTTVSGMPATGPNLVNASYGGDTTYSGSTSSTVTLQGPNNASITSPTPGSTLTSASTTFTWNVGPTGTTGYGLNVGTSFGAADLVNIGPLSGTSVTVNLPTNGATIYVRLWTILNGTTYLSNNYTYTEFTQLASAITSPTPGSTLTSASTTFTWNAGPAGTTGYGLNVGTSPGAADLVNIGPLSGTSVTVNLPANGATIYVRLWTIFSGTTYFYNDYTYTEFTQPASAITNPVPGSTLTSASTTFTWNAGRAGTTGYGLNVGTSPGAADLVNIGPLSGTSATVTLPTNGAAIYVRLWTILNGTTYFYNDYTYTEFTQSAAAITSPAPGSTLTSASTIFTWSPASGGTVSYGLNIGTSLGGADLVNIYPLSGNGANLTLPTNGQKIYVRLWTVFNGTTYLYNDYIYTELTQSGSAITSPPPGSTLTSASTTFTWSAGPPATSGYGLNVGTSPGGADLVNIGPLSGASATVTLPTNGATIYVRLWTIVNGTTYLYNDYTYTEAAP
jgi:subtilase family serine protease